MARCAARSPDVGLVQATGRRPEGGRTQQICTSRCGPLLCRRGAALRPGPSRSRHLHRPGLRNRDRRDPPGRSRWSAWPSRPTAACSSGRRTASSASSRTGSCCRRRSSTSAPRSTRSTTAASGASRSIRNFATNGYVYLTYTFENGGNPNSRGPETVAADARHGRSREPRRRAAGQRGHDPRQHRHAAVQRAARRRRLHRCRRRQPHARLAALRRRRHAVRRHRATAPTATSTRSLRAQDLDSPSGKILRINNDGTAPSDNPFYDGTNSMALEGLALRRPQPVPVLAAPGTGDIFFGDVGWNTWEEVNRGAAGTNYGWPCYEGTGPQPCYQASSPAVPALAGVASRRRSTRTTTAPARPRSAARSTPARLYPAQYQGNFFFADYSGNFIQRVVFDAEHQPV